MSVQPRPTRETAPSTSEALAQWLSAVSRCEPPTKGPVLVVCLRNRLWIEWSLYTACYLYRLGYRPVLLFSSREVDAVYDHEARGGVDADLWSRVRALSLFDFADLDASMPRGSALPPEYLDLGRENAHTTLAYNLGVEAFEAAPDSLYARALPQAGRLLARMAVACERLLGRFPAGIRAVCPSGLIGWSGSFLAAAAKVGISTTYVEFWTVRPGHMIWNRDRPAVELDLAGWREAIGPWTLEREREIDAFMTFRETPSQALVPWIREFKGAQRSAKEEGLPPRVEEFLRRPGPHFFLGPNVVGDSAILRRATIFRSQQDWIASTCAFFRRSPAMNLVIRAHPLEVSSPRTKIRLGEVAREAAGAAPNICVVPGDEDVNSYAITARVQAGLVWTSTVGVDMVSRGKPVLVVARAPYLDLGVGTAVTSQGDYHRLLTALGQANNPVGEEMIRASKVYQWIAFREMSLRATTPELLAGYYRLPLGPAADDEEKFYRILAGELDARGRAL